MKTRLPLSIALITAFSVNSAFAQDETDALRYSTTSSQGTARSIGFGNALGSLGGDFSSLSVNPAGIGVYRRSEFTFTPSVKINSTKSTYTGKETDDNNSRFTINNLGVVFTGAERGQRYERSKWKSVSFGIGINRIADFNRTYTYNGFNDIKTGSSGAEAFSIDANKYPNDVSPGPNDPNYQSAQGTLAYMGYQSYLLDTANGNYIPVTFYTSGVNQQRIVSEKGGISDINISLGGNYDEKLMLGFTIGIPSIVYKRQITYSETDATNNANNFFQSFEYKESLTTKGTGINLKIGAIAKPVDFLRIGLALHTPTYFGMKDIQDKSITTNTENFKTVLGASDKNPITSVSAPTNEFEYSMSTPWKGVLSLAGIFGKYGFISADFEYVDYASARFYYDARYSSQQSDVNQTIKNTYKGAPVFRIGAEGRIQQFAIRAGFGYNGSPYKSSAVNAQRLDISAGVGFRTDSWFIDLALMHSIFETSEIPYTLNYNPVVYAPTATINNSLNNAALTFGVKF
ncbi:MAG: hypothetical protein JST82_02565 [Bacteroidetes bacterium]|nr:hypothetical protein [Bacteroidota bacterium]